MKKRIIALITMLALCISMFCISASAASATVTKTVDGVTRTISCYLYRTYSNVTASMSGAGNSRTAISGTCTQTTSNGAGTYYRSFSASGIGSCSTSVGPIASGYVITYAYATYYAGANNLVVTSLSA